MMPLCFAQRAGVDLRHHQRHVRRPCGRPRSCRRPPRRPSPPRARSASTARRPPRTARCPRPRGSASVSSCTAISPPRNFIVLPAERAEASRRSSDQREFALLEALHELDAHGAGGAGDGDDGILAVADGLGRSMTFSCAPNEKAPRVSSRGLGCSLLLSISCAQDIQGPGGLGLDASFSWSCESWGAKCSGAAGRRKGVKRLGIRRLFR